MGHITKEFGILRVPVISNIPCTWFHTAPVYTLWGTDPTRASFCLCAKDFRCYEGRDNITDITKMIWLSILIFHWMISSTLNIKTLCKFSHSEFTKANVPISVFHEENHPLKIRCGVLAGQTSPLSTSRVLIDAAGLCLLRVSEVWQLFSPDLRRWINSFSDSDFKPRLVYKTWYFCYFFTNFGRQF